MANNKNIAHLSEIPVEEMKTPDDSPFGGRRQRVATAIGAKKLGYSVFSVPPGKAAFPFHLHHANEEMIYVLDGEGLMRTGEDEATVSSGAFIAFAPGADHPHQLINTSKRDLRYLCVSTMEYPDITEYPDSKKIGVLATSPQESGLRAFYRKDASVPYFEDESGAETRRVKKSV